MISMEGLTGRVIMQGSPGYDDARKNYNGRFDRYPLAIVYCRSEQDVINAILWIRKNRLPFRIRGGGHSYKAYSLVDGGLIIDVSGLLTLEINRENLTMRAGAGRRLLMLYEKLWDQGMVLPAGTCSSVCLSGLTLGGGYGLLSRLYGMTCDNLLEVEMVTAKGEIIRANDNEHSDLLWACRGGGDGNFGVITSLTFRTHPIGDVAYYRLTWDFSDLRNVMHYWQTWAPNADPRLTPLLALPAQNHGDLRSNGVFVGSEQELREIMRPLIAGTQPRITEFHSTTWIEAARLYAGPVLRQEKFKHSSAYIYKPLTDEALDVMIHYLQTAPGQANEVTLDACGGTVGQVPADATAFVHRKALFVIQYLSYWTQDIDAAKNINWIEEFRQAMLPHTQGAYRDYADSLIKDWPSAYFGENLEKLIKVKQEYDPENLFRFEQSIPV